jgi:DNA-binding response OmpR family regulator
MKKIVLIEDDPALSDITRLVLERAGYQVVAYASGDPVLNDIYELPDLFILDKQLGGIDGLEVCRVLKSREKSKHVPVIMLSASPHIGTLSQQAGADDYLEKPFSTKELRDLTAKYISQD